MATQTANSLVLDLAKKFQGVEGVPATLVKDILDRARALQDQLFGVGESSPDLRRSKAVALDESTEALLTLGDTASALASAREALEIMINLANSDLGNSGWQRDLSVPCYEVGDVQIARGDFAGALESYTDSFSVADRLAKSNPSSLSD